MPLTPTPAASLGDALRRALVLDMRLEPASPDVGQHHRRVGDADVISLANTANTPCAARPTVRTVGRAEWWDPLTGATRAADVVAADRETMTRRSISRRMDRWCHRRARRRPRSQRRSATTATPAPRGPRIEVRGPWTITFPDGVAQPRTRDAPTSWDADEDTRFFSGVATYDASFMLNAVPRGSTVTLEFGPGKALEPADKGLDADLLDAPIRDAAVVTINGQRAGRCGVRPFWLDISAFVRPGTNTVSIRVGNTALNHMAGRPLPDYRLLNLRYGERFQAQGMELIRPLPSGLVGPVAPEVTRLDHADRAGGREDVRVMVRPWRAARAVLVLGPLLAAWDGEHHDVEHLGRVRHVRRRHHHLDDQHLAAGGLGLAAVAEDPHAALLVPVVDDVRQDGHVAEGRDPGSKSCPPRPEPARRGPRPRAGAAPRPPRAACRRPTPRAWDAGAR